MKTNVGNADRIIRMIAGLTAIALGLFFKSWWGAIGMVFLFTALFSFCPFYSVFGVNSSTSSNTAR